MPISDTLPRYTAEAWFGLLAPKGTPREIVERLNAALDMLQSQTTSGASSVSQAAAVAALNSDAAFLPDWVATYRQRRDTATRLLNEVPGIRAPAQPGVATPRNHRCASGLAHFHAGRDLLHSTRPYNGLRLTAIDATPIAEPRLNIRGLMEDRVVANLLDQLGNGGSVNHGLAKSDAGCGRSAVAGLVEIVAVPPDVAREAPENCTL